MGDKWIPVIFGLPPNKEKISYRFFFGIIEYELRIKYQFFSGENDDGFKDMAPALAAKFSQCLEVHSQTAGHNPPYQSDSTYNQILNFIRDGLD